MLQSLKQNHSNDVFLIEPFHGAYDQQRQLVHQCDSRRWVHSRLKEIHGIVAPLFKVRPGKQWQQWCIEQYSAGAMTIMRIEELSNLLSFEILYGPVHNALTHHYLPLPWVCLFCICRRWGGVEEYTRRIYPILLPSGHTPCDFRLWIKLKACVYGCHFLNVSDLS